MSLLTDFARVTRRRPCPVCGKPDWCLVSRDDDVHPGAAICKRVESKKRWKEAGWFHLLRPGYRHPGRFAPRKIVVDQWCPRREDLPRLMDIYRGALREPHLRAFSGELDLPYACFARLEPGLVAKERLPEVGVLRAQSAIAFPMRTGGGRLCGIRLRLPGRVKITVKGSRHGLFIPSGLAVTGGLLLIAEGESDTAAALALGLEAVGRPSCHGGAQHVIDLVRHQAPAQVVVVADGDAPGREGADALATSLSVYCRDVRSIEPPEGVGDMAEWVAHGATADAVLGAQEAAQRLSVTVKKGT